MTITLTREEAQQVLDALWRAVSTCFDQYSHEQVMSNPKHFINQTIETLRSRLSAPEPEQTRSEKMREAGITRRPKGWSKEDEPEPVVRWDSDGWGDLLVDNLPDGTLLYTTPPQRERVQFPTMLRKMWSGTEVQAWLDENVNQENNNE